MKLKPGEAEKVLRSINFSYNLQRINPEDGTTLYVSVIGNDMADYVRELETGLARLALAVAEKL